MRISFGTRIKSDKIHQHNGYGYATKCMLESLQRLGYHVEDNDSTADVEIWFDQPQHWDFNPNSYKIGYHPWESTLLLDGWAEIMNECDEIWTPSPIIANWYRKYNGITVPIYVYEHGIEHDWTPVQREVEGNMKFLHIGAEAARKGGWTSMRLFKQAMVEKNDVELTLKMINSEWNGVKKLGKTNFINEKYDFDQLQELFYDHHVYIYPSWGEGFGLTPLQAMASGMPTITVPGWAPYKRFIDPNLAVESELAASTWKKIHPGKMLRPKFDSVISAVQYAYENYDEVSDFAMKQAPQIHAEYDWDTITKRVFSDLEKRLK